ncbi:MAG: aminotransferase class III-fold pyridoxal phosphate-dependent enzyme, partial [Gammaproteobacteria bacterium]
MNNAGTACTAAGASALATELLALKAQYIMPCVYHFYREPMVLERGEGCYLFDSAGRRYLDCYAGVGVSNAGHANPQVVEAAVAQLLKLAHTTTIYLTEPTLRLAEALA